MFNEQDPYVQFKLDTLKRATPAQSEGFDIVHEAEFPHHSLTEQWIFWGCVAERKETSPRHWSAVHTTPGLQHLDW